MVPIRAPPKSSNTEYSSSFLSAFTSPLRRSAHWNGKIKQPTAIKSWANSAPNTPGPAVFPCIPLHRGDHLMAVDANSFNLCMVAKACLFSGRKKGDCMWGRGRVGVLSSIFVTTPFMKDTGIYSDNAWLSAHILREVDRRQVKPDWGDKQRKYMRNNAGEFTHPSVTLPQSGTPCHFCSPSPSTPLRVFLLSPFSLPSFYSYENLFLLLLPYISSRQAGINYLITNWCASILEPQLLFLRIPPFPTTAQLL